MAFSSWIRNWKRSIERRWALHQTIRRKNAARRRASRVRLEALEDRFLLSGNVIVVTNTNNSGSGSFADAINQANALGNTTPGGTEIDFNIGTQGSNTGVHTITLGNAASSYLPTLTANGVFINGFSQNQWEGSGSGTQPLIEVNGAALPIGIANLTIANGTNTSPTSPDTGDTVQGLFLTNGSLIGIELKGVNNTLGGLTAGQGNVFSGQTDGYGVWIDGSSTKDLIVGNYIGTNEAGNAADPNFYGIYDVGGDNTIGGTVSGARNIISGNQQIGVWVNTSGVIMEGNYVGLNAAGTSAIGNGTGISVTVSGNVINGGNVISGNNHGIDIWQGGVTVEGNYIGTNAAGTGAIGNTIGVNALASAVLVGGTTSAQGNLISGNLTGIAINSSGDVVENNLIGTNAAGTGSVGNQYGINITGSNNTVGAGNTIAHNSTVGVEVSTGAGNTITQNSIFSNGGSGTGPGITVNTGANNSIGAPTISTASITDYTLTVTGTFNASAKNVPYVLEFYSNTSNDAEGRAYIGSLTVTPTATGTQNFTYTTTTSAPRFYPQITATLTDHSGNTSKFSNGKSSATVYTVTSAADDGKTGELRDAITQANAGKATTIVFAIGKSGSANTISLASALPALTGTNIFINGMSQGGYGTTTPLITVDGSNVGPLDGFQLNGSSEVVSGLVIQNFNNGVEVSVGANNIVGGPVIGVGPGFVGAGTVTGMGNVISSNFSDGVLIDAGASGTAVQGNSIGLIGTNNNNGVEVDSSNGVTIGGTSATTNVLSGNITSGITIDSGVSGVLVQGNYIGTDATGATAFPFAQIYGIDDEGLNNTIGGSVAGAGNLISGSSAYGLILGPSNTGDLVQGNYIGTDATGAKAIPNSVGVFVQDSGDTIGGTATGAGNVISGNTGDGVLIQTSGTLVQGNYIGTDKTGASALANSVGVHIIGSNNTVGGGNTIGFNSSTGVLVSTGAGDTITQNSIFANGPSNTGPGITIDSGANNNIAAPTISSASISGYTLTVSGTFNATTANVPYVLEFFASPTNDPEGKVYAGRLVVTPTSTGSQSFTFSGTTSAPRTYPLITATLTGPLGSTSTFSNGKSSTTIVTVTSAADTGTGTLRAAITSANTTGNTTIDFAIGAVGSTQTIALASALPTLTGSNIFINGTSQGGFGNTVPLVTLDGTKAGSSINGLTLTGSNEVVSGFIVQNFSKNGVEVSSGVNDVIGGAAVGLGNVIGGNANDGVLIDGAASGVAVQGNLIGVQASENGGQANSVGVSILGSNNTIGGTTAATRNIISGNATDGVLIASGASGNQVLGNYIGTPPSGTLAAPFPNFPNGFANAGSTFTFNGGSKLNGNVLDLTDGTGSEARSIFTNSEVPITHFTTSWTMNFQNASADGMTFTIQSDSPTALGGGGGSLGYQGIGKSIALKFDLYNNAGEGNNSTGLFTDGNAPFVVNGDGSFGGTVNMGGTGLALHGSHTFTVTLTYDGSTLNETVTNDDKSITFKHTYTGVNIASWVGGSNAYIGFTAGTGGATFIGTIYNWVYTTGGGLPNSVGVSDSGSHTTISSNLISGNSTEGLQLSGSGTTVQSNYIGTDLTGTSALGNSVGVLVSGNNVTLGGLTAGAGNVISGNLGDGVNIASAVSGTVLLGNYIGTDHTGTKAVANAVGVEVSGTSGTVPGASSISIGNGGGVTARNIISGNTGDGVLIDSGASGVGVLGNYIGTDSTGTLAVGNSIGVEVAGSSNSVGGATNVYKNIISGNIGDGVLVDSTGAGNLLEANYVGTDVSGHVAVGNSGSGIELAGNNNTVGGTASVNIITSNSVDGVHIDSGASGNLVLGNTIGNVYGSGGNGGNGVYIAGNSNTIGGTVSGALNVIGGNTGDGVLIAKGSSKNLVQVNWIGNYVTALSNSIGVEVAGVNNTIGGPTSLGNVISGNTGDGVKIDAGSVSNHVLGNTIGVNYNDSAALANSGNGIEVGGSFNTLGASWSVAPNEISGNSGSGIKLDSGGSGNLVIGSFIGTNLSGTAAYGNSIGVEDGGTNNTIGGVAFTDRNVISGNSGDGVLIDSSGTRDTMNLNFVGLDYSASTVIANSGNGVEIQGSGNTIGGDRVANQFVINDIAGNKGDGVLIGSGASGNQVGGNFIGLNFSGGIGLGNSIGVEIQGSGNTLGGASVGYRNVIAASSGDGVLLDSTGAANVVETDYVGTNYNAQFSVANSVGIEVAGNNNTIGASAGSANVISGNSGDGVLIDKSASGTQVLGNTIGVNYYDGGVVANSGNGIEVAGSNNTLGGSFAVAFNEISGNKGDGIKLDSGSSGTVVLGSFIGTDHTGTIAYANSIGIEDGGSSDTIGGSVLGNRNVISGNSGDGVLIDGSNDTVLGNVIGTDYSNSFSLANGTNGVEIQGAGNTIGGLLVSSLVRNDIDGNSKGAGVKIDSGANGNQVFGNFIGVNVSGTVGLANSIGVEDGGSSNTIGGPTNQYTNVISGNSGDGVLLDSAGTGNVLQSNLIGTDYTGQAALANSGNGVEIAGSNNTVGGASAGNSIAFNSKDGVLVSAGSGDTISQNSIFANTTKGITIASGANNNIAAPTISSASISSGTLTVTGTFTATVGQTYLLEFFADSATNPQGRIYLGNLSVPATLTSQPFTLTTTNISQLGTYPDITATLTDSSGDTSAFSGGVTAS